MKVRYSKNYIDKMKIEKQEEKCFSFGINYNFETDFENAIVTKSCVNLKIKSIKDKNIFTKQYRHFSGLKVLLIYDNHNFKEKVNYIKKLLDNGKYKVIPTSEHYYKISFSDQHYYISFDGKNLIVCDEGYNPIYKYDYPAPEYSMKDSLTSKTDIYRGTYRPFKNDYKDLELIVLSSEAEVDGFFETFEEIKLDSFKAQIAYSNIFEECIHTNSLLLYEIKSGNQPSNLIEQMRKRCHFICNYLKIFFQKQIYYLGFYKDYTLKELEINLDNSQSSNENELRETEENSYQKNDDKNKKESSPEENTQNEKNNDLINNIINNEQTGKTNEKMGAKTPITNLKDDLTKKEPDFSSLNNLPAEIAIFKLGDKIFNEKLIYEKEELNLLGSLRDDNKIIKKEINKIKKKIGEMDNKIGEMDNKMDKKIGNLEARMSNVEKIMLAIAEKLDVKVDINSTNNDLKKDVNENI